jgi:hypothetical protein
MKKVISLGCGAALLLSMFGAASANADPGPHHGNNKKGLCTAYFNGSEQGREKKRQAPPFQALEEAAEANEQTVEEFCAGFVGGNPGAADAGSGNAGGRP